MAETFKLPSSSYEELIKLFQAYANTKEGTALSLDDITQATGCLLYTSPSPRDSH